MHRTFDISVQYKYKFILKPNPRDKSRKVIDSSKFWGSFIDNCTEQKLFDLFNDPTVSNIEINKIYLHK